MHQFAGITRRQVKLPEFKHAPGSHADLFTQLALAGLAAIIADKGVLDSADFKLVIDSSRKYALAILDYLDARRITVRIDNNRKLAPNYEKNLL